MIHRSNMTMVDGGAPAERIVNEVLSSPYTRLPLWKDEPENIVGILHAKDVLRALVAVGGDARAIDPLGIATKPWFIPETTMLTEQMAAFRRSPPAFRARRRRVWCAHGYGHSGRHS